MSERSHVLALLDELQAAEAAGAAAMSRWIAVAEHPVLRGGLRVIAARDAAHAALARERLEALGGIPGRAPSPARVELLRLIEAPDVADDTKLRAMAARLPTDHRDRVQEAVASIVEDLETRALVETMGDDDRTSLAWLRAMSEWTGETSGSDTGDPALVRAGLAALAVAEAASAGVFRAWGEGCESPGLRGGLRTIAAREATHAELLSARLTELGGPAGPDEPPAIDFEAIAAAGGRPTWGDVRKIDTVVGRYPTPESVVAPVRRIARESDAETDSMLRLVAEGEQATIAWLRAYRRAEPAAPGATRAPVSATARGVARDLDNAG